MRSGTGLPRREGSFLVRLREDIPGDWTGQVEHIQTGGKRLIQSSDDLLGFIRDRMDVDGEASGDSE